MIDNSPENIYARRKAQQYLADIGVVAAVKITAGINFMTAELADQFAAFSTPLRLTSNVGTAATKSCAAQTFKEPVNFDATPYTEGFSQAQIDAFTDECNLIKKRIEDNDNEGILPPEILIARIQELDEAVPAPGASATLTTPENV